MEKLLKVKDKEYKIRLTAWQVKCLEEREQKGLLFLIRDMEDAGLVTQTVIKLLHASLLHYQSTMKIEEVYDIWDELVEFENYDLDKFAELIEEILKSAGLYSGKIAQ